MDLTIKYGFHPTPFGRCFIAVSSRGICALSFHEKPEERSAIKVFARVWANAELRRDQKATAVYVAKIFDAPKARPTRDPLRLLCRGTNFQIKVWEALLKIKPGQLTTYQSIAQAVGNPKAVRAVGTAIGNNPVAYLIPCHRVIRGMGHMGGYRWGLARKRAILALEISS